MIGKRIKELRERWHMSQKELAAAISMGTTAINNYENGHRVPDANTILSLAEYFGVTTDYLLGKSSQLIPDMDLQSAAKLLRISDGSAKFIKECEYRGTLDAFLSNSDIDDFFQRMDDYIYALEYAREHEQAEILSYELSKKGKKYISLEEAGDAIIEHRWRKVAFKLQGIAKAINDYRYGRDV